MIDQAEIEGVAARFGAPSSQIIRDHLISHILAAIGKWSDNDPVTFFGGTALCRTWLPDLRLSEDIDLLVESAEDGQRLRQAVATNLRREFPSREWTQLGAQHQVETWLLTAGQVDVRMQFVHWRDGWKSIPLAPKAVELRYSDLGESVALVVPTPSGFATMKLLAWFDRHAPRDLFDLAALADAKHIDRPAVDLVKTIAGFTPSAMTLDRHVPKIVESSWQTELGHQLADIPTAEECLAKVRSALDQLDQDNRRP